MQNDAFIPQSPEASLHIEEAGLCNRLLGAFAGLSTISGGACLVASIMAPLQALTYDIADSTSMLDFFTSPVDSLEISFSMLGARITGEYSSTTTTATGFTDSSVGLTLPDDIAATYKGILGLVCVSLFIISICVLLSYLVRSTTGVLRYSYPVALLLASIFSGVAAILAAAKGAPSVGDLGLPSKAVSVLTALHVMPETLPYFGTFFLFGGAGNLFTASIFAAVFLTRRGRSRPNVLVPRQDDMNEYRPSTTSSMVSMNHSPSDYRNYQPQSHA